MPMRLLHHYKMGSEVDADESQWGLKHWQYDNAALIPQHGLVSRFELHEDVHDSQDPKYRHDYSIT